MADVLGGVMTKSWCGALLLGCLLAASFVTPVAAEPLPTFPVRNEPNFPQTPNGLAARARAGDAFALLLVASRTQCRPTDDSCWLRLTETYRQAEAGGQTVAPAMLRQRLIESGRATADAYPIGASVCGQTRADAGETVQQISAIAYHGETAPWTVQEARGSRGSEAIIVSRGAVTATLFYSGDNLRLVRVVTILLNVGPSEADVEAVKHANSAIAEAICPTWTELGAAMPGYLMGAAQSWPPQAVYAEGPSAWFAATGVTPDIFWFDLYVDPSHNAFTSGGTNEQFQPVSDGGLLGPPPAH